MMLMCTVKDNQIVELLGELTYISLCSKRFCRFPMKVSSVRGSSRTMSPTPIMLSRSDVFTSILDILPPCGNANAYINQSYSAHTIFNADRFNPHTTSTDRFNTRGNESRDARFLNMVTANKPTQHICTAVVLGHKDHYAQEVCLSQNTTDFRNSTGSYATEEHHSSFLEPYSLDIYGLGSQDESTFLLNSGVCILLPPELNSIFFFF